MKETKKINPSEIRLIALSKYYRPKPVEKENEEWVLNGQNNSFYQYIINRYNGSSTNSAILNSYIDLTYGQGLRNNNGNVEDWLKFKRMIKDEQIRRIVADYTILGEAIMQITKANNPQKLPSVHHLPKELTAPEKVNEDGEIEAYFYCEDWSKAQREEYEPEKLPILDDGKGTFCLPIRPYKVGAKYFSDPDYLAGFPYALMEEEMANYYTSHIKNGLSFGYIINIPDGNSYSEDEKNEIERKIKQKLTGSTNAGKFIINFNGRDAEITITNVEMNDAHSQWAYLTEESRQQLLTAHRVTSPMLFGIKDNTGFGNNAEEMDTAEAQLMKRVVSPKQRYLLEAFTELAEFWNLNLALSFVPLSDNPIDKTQNLSVDVKMSEDNLEEILLQYAQDPPDGYELSTVDEYELDFSAIQKSEQDTDKWKIRYAYAKGTSKSPKGGSRDFCNRMLSLSASGKVFRKEDIEAMSAQGINGQFAHSGGKYDIFLYAGGVNCYHRWERRMFKKKRNPETGDLMKGNAMQNTTEVSVTQARGQGAKIPQNDPDVAIAEIDKPNKGRYPS